MKRDKFNRHGVLTIALSHFTHDLYPAFLPALIPFLIQRIEFSYTMTGLLFFLLRAPSLFNILIGIFADRFSTRYFVIAAPAVTAIIMSFTPQAGSYLTLCIMLFLTGISSAAFHVPAPVMINHISGKKTGTGMSFFMVGGELARTAGPLLLIGTIEYIGYGNSYLMMILGILSSIFVYFQFKNVSIKKDFKKNEHPFKSISETWTKMKFIFFIIFGMVIGRAFLAAALKSFLPLYMTNKGYTVAIAGASLSILELAGAAGAFSSGTLSDKLGRKKLLHIVTFSLPVLMSLFVFTEGWVKIMMLVFLGVLLFSMTPVNLALVQDHGYKYPASANSIYMTLNFVVNSGTVLLFGVISDFISLDTTYIITIAVSLVSIPFVFFLPERTPMEKVTKS